MGACCVNISPPILPQVKVSIQQSLRAPFAPGLVYPLAKIVNRHSRVRYPYSGGFELLLLQLLSVQDGGRLYNYEVLLFRLKVR